jgi:hypothetical protein
MLTFYVPIPSDVDRDDAVGCTANHNLHIVRLFEAVERVVLQYHATLLYLLATNSTGTSN